MTNELAERSPEEIERQIAETRASLDRKLHEIELRISPREQLRRLSAQVDSDSLVPWAALGAVATGTYLALTGWRRSRRHDGASDPETLLIAGPCP